MIRYKKWSNYYTLLIYIESIRIILLIWSVNTALGVLTEIASIVK